jgi:hypothetical protein
MSTLNELKGVTALVYLVLEHFPETRNNDGLLWLKVLEHQAYEKDIDLRNLAIPYFLPRIRELGFTPFESVRRTRQKLQATYHHLAAAEAVQAFRAENEAEYREYARGNV